MARVYIHTELLFYKTWDDTVDVGHDAHIQFCVCVCLKLNESL